MIRLLPCALLWANLMLGAVADPGSARIAVIADAASKNLSALVTTELSTNPAIVVVEREDLAKVGDELKVQQLAGNDAVALGKLVNAQGLLFLGKTSSGIDVRFTAVGLGYALFDDQVPDNQKPDLAAKSIAHRVLGYASKLQLDPAAAIPLSILNLRADYGAAESLQIERNLTLLLESRLTSVPEYVVLERRHAWSLGFEHSLDPAAEPILRGAYLIDGTLSISTSGTDECKVVLRVRVPGGNESTLSVEGTTEDLPGLAEQILAGIQKTIGKTKPVANPPSKQEADEYLSEALWGWRAGAPEAALEAVDSAELLGGNEADVTGLRIQALLSLCDAGMGDWFPFFDDPDKLPSFDPKELSNRTDLVLRALQETARYRAENLESKIEALKLVGMWEVGDFKTGTLEAKVVNVASKLLVLQEHAQSLRADELRQALRQVTEYDPLHGNPGKRLPGTYNNTISRALFANDWAQTLEEELAYYRLICTDNEQVLPTSMIFDPQKLFCTRFLSTPEARQKGFDDFIESLQVQPASRRTYFVLKTHAQDSQVADIAYRDYLAELWAMRDQLVQSNSYTAAIESSYDVDQAVAKRNGAVGLPLLHCYLTTDKPGSCALPLFKMLWQPDAYSTDQAATLWPEIQDYRKRWTDAAWKKYGHPDDSFDSEMDQLMRPFVQKFAAVCVAPASAEIKDALKVTKFWHPWILSGTPEYRYINQSWNVSSDGVWLGGYHTDGALYHIDLTRLTSERVPLPGKDWPQQIASTSNAVYITYIDTTNGKVRMLGRYDIKSQTWRSRPLPELAYLKLFVANDSLYMFVTVKAPFQESALVHYDWDKANWIELANNRRRPGRNQFDDTEPLIDVSGIFTGPQHQACVTLGQGTFFVDEKEGPWQPVFDDSCNSTAITEGNRTLVMNFNGEATLLDADASAPEYWIANPTPHYRTVGKTGKANPPAPTPWAPQARWQVPADKPCNWRYTSGFHDDNLYVLNIPREGDHYEVICYIKGDKQSPRHVPLSFHLDDRTRTTLASHPNIGNDSYNEWKIDVLEHPESTALHSGSLFLHIMAANQGLCIVYDMNGFWFLPYKDIDAYLKSHPDGTLKFDSPSTVSTPVSKNAAESSGNVVDPGDPSSFE